MVKKKGEEEKATALLQKAEVSLVLDDYEDMFSDFDPRPYSNKALSVDLLDEAKRATRQLADEKFGLTFLISASKRNADKEKVIKGRLKEHFKKHKEMLEKEHSRVVMQGIYFLLFGLVFMFFAAYILFFYHDKINFIKEFLVVLLEPGGWFLFWEGLDLILFETKKIKPDLTFYRKMVKAEIIFTKY